MTDSSLRDECPYRLYNMDPRYYHVPNEIPSILKRTSRLISAAVNNHLDILQELLDSPYWYNVIDRDGYNLLHISMWFNSKTVFNYLLSLPNFPLEPLSKSRETILDLAWESDIENFNDEDDPRNQYYMCKLLQKGIELVTSGGTDILHVAAEHNHPDVLKLLIDQGKDINVPDKNGETALDLALSSYQDWFYNDFEVVSTLLENDAVVTVYSFEKAVFNDDISHEVEEFLYLYIKDLISEFEINFRTILQLAKNESPLFDEIIKCPLKIKINVGEESECFRLLGVMKPIYVREIFKIFGYAIFEIFETLDFFTLCGEDPFNIESLDVLLQSDLQSEMIRFISVSEGLDLTPYPYFDPKKNVKDLEKKTTELYCFLLSYGLNVSFGLLEHVYCKFGYCELFKILLHMDVIEMDSNQKSWLLFFYNPKMSLETFLENPCYHERNLINILIHYFRHPKVLDVLLEDYYKVSNEFSIYFDEPPAMLLEASKRVNQLLKCRNLMLMPCLKELARNTFREYFVSKFDIKTSSQFLTMLNSLPINNVYKKIISYETKLY